MKIAPNNISLMLLVIFFILISACNYNKDEVFPTKVPTPTILPTVTQSKEMTVWIGSQNVPCPTDPDQLCFLYKGEKQENWLIFSGIFIGFDYWPGSEYEVVLREDTITNPTPGRSALLWTLLEGLTKKTPSSAIALGAENFSKTGASGEMVRYLFTITQLNDKVSAYSIESSGDGNPIISESLSPVLKQGETFTFTMDVLVPGGTSDIETVVTLINIKSMSDPTIQASQVITTVNRK